MKAIEYTCGFLHCVTTDRILLLRKEKPLWQRGKLNGIGGKIELGEDPLSAMRREWSEETQRDITPQWELFATLHFPEAKVHFFRAQVNREVGLPTDGESNDVGEMFMWVARDALPHVMNIIPNLIWIIPMGFGDDRVGCAQVAMR